MRGVVVLLVVSACNQAFGLHETQQAPPIDAQQFDAPSDAAFACVPGHPPLFSPLLHQAVTQNCVFYTVASGGLAAADCLGELSDGMIDSKLSPSTITPAPTTTVGFPRLTPEGDEMWVRREVGGVAQFTVYRRAGDQGWAFVRDLAFPTSGHDDTISAPTRRGPDGRRFIQHAFGEGKLYEYADDGTTTTAIRSYTGPDFGVDFFEFPNLTADGLRLVFVSELQGSTTAATFYSERASITDSFPAAVILVTAPVAFDPFLTEDCGRLYSNGLGSVFYAQQL